ncbi:alpha-ketoglutarate-dependent dioxygenase AlkB family protein [Gillisia hiemivivida]|uniref:Alpha-ketoglutarate-dependent dioxygenase AlkB n=1 Tax=Gillisia hiemivivida TaxID=291190 RepID=A0A5C6ZRT6_9FLAO|nr:alpha-ketoglutarate-dependent dioxygenase AlkB [Gillisia hiemivivida]TXD92413.1 alpha-ketoglutarate-dependent dioxygenase AlkB [Gillisia hiemivivida]
MNFEFKSGKITIPDANLEYYPNFLNNELANSYYKTFLNTLEWEQYYIKLFGKTIPQPRLTALYAINSEPYTYSALKLQPIPFTEELSFINSKILELTGSNFTHCLANLYRDGNDSMGWHADDEKELGKNPIIASLSLGAVRNFQLKHKTDSALKYALALEHGSLLIMKGSTQEFWKHQLPKTKKEISPRINLTFRTII